MKRISPLLVLLCVSVIFTVTACGQFQAKIDIKQGNDLYRAKQYEPAIEKYKSALAKDPSIDLVWLNLGLSYMALYVPGSTHPKDVEYATQAINSFREYLKTHADDPKVNEYLITMYLNAERMDDAIAYFEDYMTKNPNDVATMQKLAFIYAKAGKFDDALRWYEKRTQVEPSAEAFYALGEICWERVYHFPDLPYEDKSRLIEKGMAALEKSMQIDPTYANSYSYENLMYREKAKLITLDPKTIPDDKVDEYNGYLAKSKEYADKFVELMKKAAAEKDKAASGGTPN